MGFNSRYHLTRAERLGDIIIRAEAETADLVDIVFFRGDHDDRGVFCLPDLFADFKSINARKHQIQDKKIKFFRHGSL